MTDKEEYQLELAEMRHDLAYRDLKGETLTLKERVLLDSLNMKMNSMREAPREEDPELKKAKEEAKIYLKARELMEEEGFSEGLISKRRTYAIDAVADYLGMLFCVIGSFVLMAYPGLLVFCIFCGACLSFGFVAWRQKLWGLFLSQSVCLILNLISIYRIVNGTWL